MTKQMRIQIFPDGRVQANVNGIPGRACTDYIKVLEELLDAETIDSSYTPEYYQSVTTTAETANETSQTLRQDSHG